jgi:hypothetical protein
MLLFIEEIGKDLQTSFYVLGPLLILAGFWQISKLVPNPFVDIILGYIHIYILQVECFSSRTEKEWEVEPY